MPNASRGKFQELDQSFSVESLLKGLAAVLLKTQRGKFGVDETIYTTWPQFKKQYGGEAVGYEGVTQAKRALERGAMLRVNKMGHYTNPNSQATLDAVKGAIDESGAIPDFAMDGADRVFQLVLKNPGANYNFVKVFIENASNGDVDSFNLRITHDNEPELNELYENIKIAGKPTIADSHFLDEVINKSMFFTPTYQNLSAAAGAAPIRPTNGNWSVTGGTDGSAPAAGDYVGDSAGKTGFYAFDNYDDFEVMASLDNFVTAVQTAGSAYAALREDLVYVSEIDKSNVSAAAIAAARAATLVDSRFTYFITGGLKIQNPFVSTGGTVPLDSADIGDVIGSAMKSSQEFGPWWAFSEQQRGLVFNALGVVNNFGPNYTDRNLLAQRQVNVVVNRAGKIYIAGNYSGQMASSRKSFINVVKLIIYLKKALRPTMEKYLSQPLDFRTFKEIFNEVNPFFQSLVGGENRALIEYEWRGDQYATKDSDMTINTRAELDKGNYVAEVYLKEAVAMNEFLLRIISAPSSVSFQDNVNQ